MTVGEKIKRIRTELNMSQDELAKKVGYKSRSSIQKIENARSLPLPKVSAMAKALNINPAYLMGWIDTPTLPEDTSDAKEKREYWKASDDISSEDKELLNRLHKVRQSTRDSINLLIEADLHKS